MYQHWGCTSIYRLLSYPVRFLMLNARKINVNISLCYNSGTVIWYLKKNYIPSKFLKLLHNKRDKPKNARPKYPELRHYSNYDIIRDVSVKIFLNVPPFFQELQIFQCHTN